MTNKSLTQLRLAIRKSIQEELHQKTVEPHVVDSMRVPEAKEKLPMYEQVIEIAKAAGHYIQKLDQMKKKEMPTTKSANAISEVLENFHALLEDMVRNPTAYLDENPDQVVSDFESDVDGQIKSMNGSD